MTQLMKAVRCHRFAGIGEDGKPLAKPDSLRDVLSLDEIPVPACDDDHVLVKVHYAGVQYPDALQAQGLYQIKPPLPYVPGMDVSGTVLQIGAGADGINVGDRVMAQVGVGGLAQVAKVPVAAVWKAPDRVHLSSCANLGRNYFSAFHSLKVVGEVTAGDLVLVDGASGGVGMASIQLAKAMGASVIAGVSSQEKMDLPRQAGADRVFCYGKDRDSYKQFKNEVKQAATELGHPEGVDAVIDVVQGELFEAALVSSVRPLGKLCLVGFTGGQKPIRPGILLIKQAAAVGSLWGPWSQANPESHHQNVQQILGFLGSGAIDPKAERVIPLDDFVQAFELYENNQGRGNTVVCLHEEDLID